MFGRPKDSARKPRAGRAAAAGGGSPKGERRGILETFIGTSGVRPPAPAPPRRLTDIAAEWFSTVIALKRVTNLPDAAALRARALEVKARFEQEARDAGFSAADIESAVFALVAFLDQTVLNSSGPARDAWISKPLQLELFGHNIAGEEFFDRLDRLRRERESRREALEVYYYCLAFGFAGKYMLAGPERLQGILSEVERDIAAVRGTGKRGLAPHAVREDEFAETVAAGFPMWLSLVVFAVAVTFTWLLVMLGSHFASGRAAAAIRALVTH